MNVRVALMSIALPVALLLTGCGGDDGSNGDSGVAAKPAPAAQTPTPVADAAACEYVANSDGVREDIDLPPVAPVRVDEMTISTNRGDIAVTFNETAPCTVNSFVSLANQGYFDEITCHRLVTEFVLQCGDPSATGMGGPGYSFADELQGDEQYVTGTLAMANAGPDTNGSQFFIVLADAQLPASYTVFGTVSEAGMTVAHEIEAAGNADGTSRPAEDVIINWVR